MARNNPYRKFLDLSRIHAEPERLFVSTRSARPIVWEHDGVYGVFAFSKCGPEMARLLSLHFGEKWADLRYFSPAKPHDVTQPPELPMAERLDKGKGDGLAITTQSNRVGFF
jgi:hypothetical protein